MDYPEKLATQGTQDEKKQKNTTQYVLNTTIYIYIYICANKRNKINKTKTGAKEEPNIVFMRKS